MKKFKLLIFIACLINFKTAAQSNVDKETFIYAKKDTLSLKLDKYEDKSITSNAKKPVIIYVHGGGFATGSRVNALQITYAKYFARKGFVSILIDYRLGLTNKTDPGEKLILDAVNSAVLDLVDATSFLISKENEWNIDLTKVIISGGSAGAITCLTTEYDLSNKGSLTKTLPEEFRYAGVISHAGAVIVTQDSLIWKRKPAPMLLFHGDKDQLVPFEKLKVENDLYAGSNYLHKQFQDAKISHWLYQEVGSDHIVALKPLQYNFSEIDNFIENYVFKEKELFQHTLWESKEKESMQDLMKVVPLYILGWNKTDDEVN